MRSGSQQPPGRVAPPTSARGSAVVVEAEDGEVGAGAGGQGADFAGEAQRGGGSRGGCLERGGLGHAGGDELGDRARQVVLGHGAEMALVDVGGDGVGRETVGQGRLGRAEVE